MGMEFPERFSNLPQSTWPRLRALLDHVPPGQEPMALSIGEPKHDFPDFVPKVIQSNAAGFRGYPSNEGIPELLDAVRDWVLRRYGVSLARENLLALNGTREGLFNAALALCPEQKNGQVPTVLIPNPFYQVYMVGALAARARPVFLNATVESGFLPDLEAIDPADLDACALFFLCSPSNPQGAVADAAYWARLMELAERHDFKVIADECYSEIYLDTPPMGALEAATDLGRVVAFHSLSKRSNLSGLRSGFAASDVANIAALRQLRAFAGAPLPQPLQMAAAAAWSDEVHVAKNRALYAEKFDLAREIFGNLPGFRIPAGGFFLWLPVPNDEEAALKLWRQEGLRTLPGSYLSQGDGPDNPGRGYIRVALVAPIDQLRDGLRRLRACLYE